MTWLLRPPAFPGEEQTQRARTFHRVAWTTMVSTTTVLLVLLVLRPELRQRTLSALIIVDVLGIALLGLNRRGQTRLASALLVGGLVSLVSALAIRAGGLRSPGVGMYVVFVLMAGLLLGLRGGIITAVACTCIGLGFAVLEATGSLPSPVVHYDAFTLWLLSSLYMGIILVLLRLATETVEAALRRAEAELVERRQVEQRLERLVIDLGKRVEEQEEAEVRRRALESQLRQAQKMEALGTLAGGIAHDFNNILTAIGFNAEFALGDLQAGHPAREHLGEIVKAHDRARDLVKRILVFGRRQESQRAVISLLPVIEETRRLLRASLPAMIEIEASYEPDLPQVAADPNQIQQVMMNLGTNAAQAMAAQGGVLSLQVKRETIDDAGGAPSVDLPAGTYVCISVKDTGTGMSDEVRERLFEPFFTTKGHAGTGLGLSVVHGIVGDHEGVITVTSTVGVGTSFNIYFPAAQAAARESQLDAMSYPRGHGEHVMYVDDEEAIVLVVRRILERLGYVCSGFSDAVAALSAFRTDPRAFDAVITDRAMPKMNGLQLVRELRAIRPDVRIAMASGYGDSAEEQQAGIRVRVSKPPSIGELGRALRALLDGQADRRHS